MNKILAERYASPEMAHIFSKESRYGKWRLVWLTLAEAQYELGFPIEEENLKKAQDTASRIDFERVKEIEKETRHDVMAHLKHWAEICPEVNTTIHLGATSSFVTDNAECMLNKEALHLIIQRMGKLRNILADLAYDTAGFPALGYTHFQPASPTTIGKRVAMWMQDLQYDIEQTVDFHDSYVCRGVKGTTGTQASYLELSGRNATKVRQLDRLFAKKLKFVKPIELSGQTLSRKYDAKLADILSGVAITLSKIGHDVRLLSHTGDLREGFAKGQVGSSAMPYKRNPMLAERLCALSRLVPQYRDMLTQTAMTQWLERSLDDSATRRVAIPDMFLAIEGALNTAIKMSSSLIPKATSYFEDPFLVSELLLARAVSNGHNRQEAHEKLKLYSLEARQAAKPGQHFERTVFKDPMWSDMDYYDISIAIGRASELVGLAEEQTIGYLKRLGYPTSSDP
jgi:adenylosuccinate lyase